jgi:YVTN family beta-propeller protein
MDFRILGPLEVRDRGETLAIGAGKQRALLAILLIEANEPVSTSRLIDELWPEDPPATAAKIVQNSVSHLRRILGDGILVTSANGYLLRVAPGELDRDRFRAALDEAKEAAAAGDERGASGVLREAFLLWRGPPLADFAYERFAAAEIDRLEELRVAATVERIDLDLAAGRHAEVVGELHGLVERFPLQERLRAQLMLALYRSGRQAEALEVFQDARRTLAGELGIEPGEALKHLEKAILTHDPSLDPPRARVLGRARTASRRSLVGVALVIVVLAVAVVVGVLVLGSHGSTPLSRIDVNAVGGIDPDSNAIVEQVPLPILPSSLAFGDGSVYALAAGEQIVSRIDAKTLHVNLIPAAISTATLTSVAYGGGAAWIVDGSFRVLRHVWAVENRLSRPSVVYGPPNGRDTPDVAVEGDSVWITSQDLQQLVEVDIPTLRRRARIHTDAVPLAIAAGPNGLWFTGFDPVSNRGLVAHVDVERRRVSDVVPLRDIPSGICVAYGSVWVTVESANLVWRIDPATGTVDRTIDVGRGPRSIAAGEGALWVANARDGTISRIDPRSNRVVATIEVGGSPSDVTVGDGRVWVSVL